MSVRHLRNINDGTIYEWHPILAEHPLCEEVSEEVVFPERVNKTRKPRKEKTVSDLEYELSKEPENDPR